MTVVTESDPREGLGGDVKSFRDWLRAEGHDVHWSLVELADAAGMNLATLYRWMDGSSKCRNRKNAEDVRKKLASMRKKLSARRD